MNHARRKDWTWASRRIGFSALLLAALAGMPVAAQETAEKDSIQLADGSTVTGQIQSEDYAGLSLKGQGGKLELIPWARVRAVEYRGGDELAAADEAVEAGRMDEAATALEQLMERSKNRPVVRQQVLHRLARLQERKGDAEAAVAAWRRLLQEFPQGRFLGEAADRLVEERLTAKDADGATKEIEQIAAATGDAAAAKPLIALLKARVLEVQGHLADAETGYESAAKAAGTDAAVKAEADLGRARTLMLDKKAAAAEPLLRGVVTADAPARVLAGAWNALGDLQLEAGRAARDQDRLLEALFAYLRSSVLYLPLPGEPTREYERALAGSARCFQFVADLEKNDERKQLFTQRARDRSALLAREFPKSEFRTNN